MLAVPSELPEALKRLGWSFAEVTVNTVTGFVRVSLMNAGSGRQITLMRSAHGARVVERRDLIELRSGMYRSHWEIVGVLGGAAHECMRDAAASLADYVNDNSSTSEQIAGLLDVLALGQ